MHAQKADERPGDPLRAPLVGAKSAEGRVVGEHMEHHNEDFSGTPRQTKREFHVSASPLIPFALCADNYTTNAVLHSRPWCWTLNMSCYCLSQTIAGSGMQSSAIKACNANITSVIGNWNVVLTKINVPNKAGSAGAAVQDQIASALVAHNPR